MGDRDKTVLEPGHEDDAPLETLCAMEGHDVDGVTSLTRRVGAQARLEPGDEPGPRSRRVSYRRYSVASAASSARSSSTSRGLGRAGACGGVTQDIEFVIRPSESGCFRQHGKLLEPCANARRIRRARQAVQGSANRGRARERATAPTAERNACGLELALEEHELGVRAGQDGEA